MQLLNKLLSANNAIEAKNKMKSIGLCSFAFCGFVSSGFIGIFNSNVLLAILFCGALMIYLGQWFIMENEDQKLILSVRAFTQINWQAKSRLLWLFPLLAMVYGFLSGPKGMGNLIDLVVIGSGIILILDAPDVTDCYKWCMKLIRFFALFYAISIWIQAFFPGIYSIYLGLLSNGSDARINALSNYYTGFATSPVHTAGYIAAGIFSFIHDIPNKKKTSFVALVFLLVSLFFTGLRMQTATIFLCIVVVIFAYTSPNKRVRLLIVLGGLTIFALVSIVVFRGQLSTIPVFRRVYNSIDSLLSGQDISSSRSGLYALAIDLFKQNPIFGIGWGSFRLEVPGIVTIRRKFDVHNIYLQLLCEVGVVGFVCFCVPIFYSLIKTIRAYFYQMKTNRAAVKTSLLEFSFLYQLFFLIVGITDNTLFNAYSQVPYLLSCVILFTCLNNREHANDMSQ